VKSCLGIFKIAKQFIKAVVYFCVDNLYLCVKYSVYSYFCSELGSKLFQRPREDSRTLGKYPQSDSLLFQSFTTLYKYFWKAQMRNLSNSVSS